jgi:hypothetical protein
VNPIDIPVIGEFHPDQIGHRYYGHFDAVYGDTLWVQRRIGSDLVGSDSFSRKDQIEVMPRRR